MSDHDLPSILASGERQANELAVKVSTPDGQTAAGEVSVTAGGESWWFKLWAKATAGRGQKTQGSAGAEFSKRWFGSWGE